MPVIPPSSLGICAQTPDGTSFPYPPTGNATATIYFDFAPRYSAADQLRIVVFSFDGESVSDTAGNTYNLDLAADFINVWSALVEYMPVAGVDSITVTEGWGFTAFVIDSTDPENYLGPGAFTSGVTYPMYPDDNTTEANTAYITLPEQEDLILGGFSSWIQGIIIGGTFGVPTIEFYPAEGGSGWGFGGWMGDSESVNEDDPPEAYLDAREWRGEVYGIDNFGLDEAPLSPYRFGCTFWNGIIGSFLDPTATYEVHYSSWIIVYRGKGATAPPDPYDTDDPLGRNPWVAIDTAARIHQAYSQEESNKVRYRVWTHFTRTTTEVDNEDGPVGRRPRMEVVPGHPIGRVEMVLEVGGGVSVTHTDDDGRTWSAMAELFPSPANRPTIAVQDNGIVVTAAYSGGKLVGRWRAPGETAFRPQYTFKLWNGDNLADLAVSENGFHLQPVPGASGTWVLTCVTSAGVKNFYSFDMETWSNAPAS
jgi:hypothetical protein